LTTAMMKFEAGGFQEGMRFLWQGYLEISREILCAFCFCWSAGPAQDPEYSADSKSSWKQHTSLRSLCATEIFCQVAEQTPYKYIANPSVRAIFGR